MKINEQIKEWLKEINKKNFVKLREIGRTHEKNEIFVLQIGESDVNKPEILLDGALHAREWISVSTTLNIIYKVNIQTYIVILS